ncbi:MAG: carboxypeptidase regulatory-like domain-containing protein [Gemmatimonadaceae bacterium]|nr:carboxypeptidase regulatory-like domain-containing protein [Gemmatimonadaceae bacterium]
MSRPRRLAACLLLALWSAWPPSTLPAQPATGTLTGRVTDAASGQPVAAAQISIVGTTNGTITSAEGQYSLRVPAGSVTIRVLRVGYSEQRQSATITAGQTTTLDVVITSVPASLSAVVSTATGTQRRLEVGNAIAQVNASDLTATRPITNVGDLLNGRAAGVAVFGGTQPGAGIRIRIRGTSSLSLSNDPIYIIDGPRKSRRSRSCAVPRPPPSTAPTPPTASSSSPPRRVWPAGRSGPTTPSSRR